jgi:hypothetical protein
MITINNNFEKFKEDFKKDTGLSYSEENLSLYLQYITARMTDNSAQIMFGLTHELLNKLDFLPKQVRLEIAEMIRDHEVIRKLTGSLV